ncbi:unnamed protein product [Paramecium primaurelia]|uniref:Transmembrane protein n=1 Tax=Paramecium primaurelia TaxID=5886 RepID=A0A8S1MJV3_PARPR|nr:unnamed protein product [Paramecium primaurelia]
MIYLQKVPKAFILKLLQQDSVKIIPSTYLKKTKIVKFSFQFSDFLVTYQSRIILIQKQEVQIMSLNFTNKFTINQQYINQHFKNIEFIPTQIVINTQILSSFLLINNVKPVIIVSIDKNNLPIPISLFSADISIKYINLVNQQLILSYFCNNNQKICFQVWMLTIYPNSILQTDYIVQIIIIIYWYHLITCFSILLLAITHYHHQFNVIGHFMTTITDKTTLINLQYFTIIVFIYFQKIQLFKFFSKNDDQIFSNSTHYLQIIYNYTITFIINQNVKFRFQKKNQIYITPNNSVTLYLNFKMLQPQIFKTVLTKENLNFQENNYTYPKSLILNRQIDYCGSTIDNETYMLNELCSLSYSAPNSSNIPNSQITIQSFQQKINFLPFRIINPLQFSMTTQHKLQIISIRIQI